MAANRPQPLLNLIPSVKGDSTNMQAGVFQNWLKSDQLRGLPPQTWGLLPNLQVSILCFHIQPPLESVRSQVFVQNKWGPNHPKYWFSAKMDGKEVKHCLTCELLQLCSAHGVACN